MFEAEVDISENSSTSTHLDWPTANSCPPLSAQQGSPAPPQPCQAPQNLTSLQPSSVLSRPETESSCMEIEAAQRKLQEIEDRYETYMVRKKLQKLPSNYLKNKCERIYIYIVLLVPGFPVCLDILCE